MAAVVAAGFLEARATRADDPCAADVKQFCGDVQPGGGRVQSCLRKNEASLSPPCKAKRAGVESKIQAIVREFALGCQRDADRLCSEVKPGKGRVLACLLRQQDDLSSSCRAETDRYQAAAEKVSDVRAACKADVERLCGPGPHDAGSVVDCLQANRAERSEGCRSVDLALAARAAEVVDVVETATSAERTQSIQQILQGIESIAFSRSQILLQFDSFDGLGGTANANRVILNPQLVFGRRNQFAVQLKAPVLTVYPYARGSLRGVGPGGRHDRVRVGLLRDRARPAVRLARPPMEVARARTSRRWVGGHAQLRNLRRPCPGLSLTGHGLDIAPSPAAAIPSLDLLLVEPIVVVNLPGRSFAALDTRLGWSFVDGAFLPLMKGIAGIYMNRQKSLSISAWYQAALTSTAKDQLFDFGVGTALAYFFDW